MDLGQLIQRIRVEPHWKEPVHPVDAPWMPRRRGIPVMSYQEEAPGQIQDLLKRLYLTNGLGTTRCPLWIN